CIAWPNLLSYDYLFIVAQIAIQVENRSRCLAVSSTLPMALSGFPTKSGKLSRLRQSARRACEQFTPGLPEDCAKVAAELERLDRERLGKLGQTR
ncbi:MAG: hypothetical protein OXG25_02410, partial [Gammaproteobacteria bacterium]|nr:hypothetical protein [Gammaproteobacteria bacterium]